MCRKRITRKRVRSLYSMTRDGTAESVSRGQILRRERGQENIQINFPCSVDHEQDWQPYQIDPCLVICDDHTCFALGKSSLLQTYPRQETFKTGILWCYWDCRACMCELLLNVDISLSVVLVASWCRGPI